MTEQFESLQDLAQESGFQILCCRDYLTWLSALARAIQLAHVHGEAEIGEGLASIAKYLGDSGISAASSAISDLDKIAETDAAPQNAQIVNRGAKRVSLADFAKGRQKAAAADLGIQQAAISKAIRVKRQIFVVHHDDGRLEAIEERPFPSGRHGEGCQ